MSSPETRAEILYYRKEAQAFTRKAMAADPGDFLQFFAENLKPSARILDVGCGCGRDLRWLRDLGFRPQGLERSPELVEIARSYSGCEVFQGDFKTWDVTDLRVEGLLFSGSLVHLPARELGGVIARFLPGLSADGILYISLKEGCGTETDVHGRFFQLWEEADAVRLWQKLGLQVRDFLAQTSASGTRWLGWVLAPAASAWSAA